MEGDEGSNGASDDDDEDDEDGVIEAFMGGFTVPRVSSVSRKRFSRTPFKPLGSKPASERRLRSSTTVSELKARPSSPPFPLDRFGAGISVFSALVSPSFTLLVTWS
jgi:hypothetical protein